MISQDYHLTKRQSQLDSIRRWGVGAFYLWGANAKSWDVARTFLRAYDNIVAKACATRKPFVYKVNRDGSLTIHKL